MAVLSSEQRQALVGRLLGLESKPPAASVAETVAPERVAPSGTVAGTEPSLLAKFQGQSLQNQILLGTAAVLAVLGALWAIRKYT